MTYLNEALRGAFAFALLIFLSSCDRTGQPAATGSFPNESSTAPFVTRTERAATDQAPTSDAKPVVPIKKVWSIPNPVILPIEQVEAEYTPGLKACLHSGYAAKGVSAAMGGCFNVELAAHDVRLNAAYRSAMAKRGPPEQVILRNAQRAWIKHRDASCEEVRMGGTIDLVEVSSCRLEETVRRRIQLQSMAG